MSDVQIPEKPSLSLFNLLDNAEFTKNHRNIWALSSMGILLDGFDLFVLSVALPLISAQLHTTPLQVGLIGAAATLGAIIGAVAGGYLTDRFGRQKILMIDLVVFIIFAILSGLSWSIESLILFRFMLGIGIGADYPICASYIAEFMPVRIRGKMLIGAFSFQAVGIFLAAAVGLAILWLYPHEMAWRFMLVVGAVPALIILILRRSVPESARWCIRAGESRRAAQIICQTIQSIPHLVADCLKKLSTPAVPDHSCYPSCSQHDVRELFNPEFRRRTILTTVPWFLMDLVFYGVGLFTPLLLASMAFGGDGMDLIASDFASSEGTAVLDIFLILGFVINIILIERVGRMRLQAYGFAGMAAGLVLMILATALNNPVALVFAGFAIYNLLMNMGPNATTFIIPAELYPTRLRGTAHGFAAGVAKIGAALGIVLVPVMKASLGLTTTLLVLLCMVLLALSVTIAFRIETTGFSLEDVSEVA